MRQLHVLSLSNRLFDHQVVVVRGPDHTPFTMSLLTIPFMEQNPGYLPFQDRIRERDEMFRLDIRPFGLPGTLARVKGLCMYLIVLKGLNTDLPSCVLEKQCQCFLPTVSMWRKISGFNHRQISKTGTNVPLASRDYTMVNQIDIGTFQTCRKLLGCEQKKEGETASIALSEGRDLERRRSKV